jgi:hypothetical protein
MPQGGTMPGPAPAPKRRRRNADVYADVQTRVPAKSGKVCGPMFRAVAPSIALFDDDVQDLVTTWWETWRRSPLAATFLNTDWQRLAMLAPLVASYYAYPHYTKLSEIRQNESLLGATHVDRLRARIKVEAETVTAPGVSSLNDHKARRDRLAG